MGVGDDFQNFCRNLIISNTSDISSRYRSITKRLNIDFYGNSSEEAHSLYVGSYGRNTAIHGAHDMDMLFVLPYDTYIRYNSYSGNGQSALLQSIRNSVLKTYPNSEIGGDGQVVAVRFSDSMRFEIVPAFKNTDGSYTFPDSNYGGSWKITNPHPEIAAMKERNLLTNGNLLQLCRMARAWRRYNNVLISGLQIDTFAYNFINTWEYKEKSYYYYDYMTRDFFRYLSNVDRSQMYWNAPGSGQRVYRKGAFESKATTTYNQSLEGISHYISNSNWSARQAFRNIYGNYFPN